jgi:hypothetical protein
LETTGLNPFQDNIVGIISDGSDKAITFRRTQTGEKQLSQMLQLKD